VNGGNLQPVQRPAAGWGGERIPDRPRICGACLRFCPGRRIRRRRS